MNETKEIEKPETLNSLLGQASFKKRFEEILGEKSAGFISSIVSLPSTNPQLQEVARENPRSIIQAAVIAATLDLPVTASLSFAFIVPYGKFAQFQIGWKGLWQLAMRTAQYKTIHVTDVYSDEVLRWNPMAGSLEVTPSETWKLRSEGKPENIAGYLAYFRLLNGFEKQYYLTVDQIRAHARRYSKSFENPRGVWMTNFPAMATKTVLKLLLSKYGLLSVNSVQMEKAIEADQGIIDVEGRIHYEDRPEPEPVPMKPSGATREINDAEFKLLCAKIDQSGVAEADWRLFMLNEFKKEHRHELTVQELSQMLKWLSQEPPTEKS